MSAASPAKSTRPSAPRSAPPDRGLRLERHAPAEDLAFFVDHHWILHWDVRDRAAQQRETLPDPCVNLEFSAGQSAVHGVGTRKLIAPLEGQGLVVGTRFKAGGFFPFVRSSVTELTDRVLSLREAFGVDVASLERAVLEAKDARGSLEVVAEFLRALHPERDENVTTVARVTAIAHDRSSIHTVEDLCAASGVQSRNLQRLFRRYVGVGPKWMIRWFRVHEAAERAARGAAVDWNSLSGELGYSDATQFFRDVKAQIGALPG